MKVSHLAEEGCCEDVKPFWPTDFERFWEKTHFWSLKLFFIVIVHSLQIIPRQKLFSEPNIIYCQQTSNDSETNYFQSLTLFIVNRLQTILGQIHLQSLKLFIVNRFLVPGQDGATIDFQSISWCQEGLQSLNHGQSDFWDQSSPIQPALKVDVLKHATLKVPPVQLVLKVKVLKHATPLPGASRTEDATRGWTESRVECWRCSHTYLHHLMNIVLTIIIIVINMITIIIVKITWQMKIWSMEGKIPAQPCSLPSMWLSWWK